MVSKPVRAAPSPSIPFGWAKYMPPVNSRTTSKLKPPAITSSLRLEAPVSAGKIMAGRKLQKSPNILRKGSRAPRSGCSSGGSASHFGPPTEPNRIASEALQISTVFSGNALPSSSMAMPPTLAKVRSKATSYLCSTASRTFKASAMTSGPIPSPDNTATLYVLLITTLLDVFGYIKIISLRHENRLSLYEGSYSLSIAFKTFKTSRFLTEMLTCLQT